MHLDGCEDGHVLDLLQVVLHCGGVCMEHVLQRGLQLQRRNILVQPVAARQDRGQSKRATRDQPLLTAVAALVLSTRRLGSCGMILCCDQEQLDLARPLDAPAGIKALHRQQPRRCCLLRLAANPAGASPGRLRALQQPREVPLDLGIAMAVLWQHAGA